MSIWDEPFDVNIQADDPPTGTSKQPAQSFWDRPTGQPAQFDAPKVSFWDTPIEQPTYTALRPISPAPAPVLPTAPVSTTPTRATPVTKQRLPLPPLTPQKESLTPIADKGLFGALGDELQQALASWSNPTTSDMLTAPIRDLPILGTLTRAAETALGILNVSSEVIGKPLAGHVEIELQQGLQDAINTLSRVPGLEFLKGAADRPDTYTQAGSTEEAYRALQRGKGTFWQTLQTGDWDTYWKDVNANWKEFERVGNAKFEAMTEENPWSAGIVALTDPLSYVGVESIFAPIAKIQQGRRILEASVPLSEVGQAATKAPLSIYARTFNSVFKPFSKAAGELASPTELGMIGDAGKLAKVNPFEYTPMSKMVGALKDAGDNVKVLAVDGTQNAPTLIKTFRAMSEAAKQGDLSALKPLIDAHPQLKPILESANGQKAIHLALDFDPSRYESAYGSANAMLNTLSDLSKADNPRAAIAAFFDGAEVQSNLAQMPRLVREALTGFKEGRLDLIQAKRSVDFGTKVGLAADFTDHMSKVGATLSKIPEANLAQRFMNQMRAYESLVFIGMNPHAIATNALGNFFSLALRGINPFETGGSVARAFQRIGFQPEEDMARLISKALKQTDPTASAPFGLGLPKWLEKNPLSQLWMKAENSARQRAWLSGFRRSYKSVWKEGVAYQRAATLKQFKPLEPFLEQVLGKKGIKQFYSAINQAMNEQELAQVVPTFFKQPAWETYFDELAQDLSVKWSQRMGQPINLTPDQLQQMVSLGVGDALNDMIRNVVKGATSATDYEAKWAQEQKRLLDAMGEHYNRITHDAETLNQGGVPFYPELSHASPEDLELMSRTLGESPRVPNALKAQFTQAEWEGMTAAQREYALKSHYASISSTVGENDLSVLTHPMQPDYMMGKQGEILPYEVPVYPETIITHDLSDVFQAAMQKGISTATSEGDPFNKHLLNVLKKHADEIGHEITSLKDLEQQPEALEAAWKFLNDTYTPGMSAPKVKPKVWQEFHYYNQNEGKFLPLEGKLVTLNNADDVQFFLHKSVPGESNKWTIAEVNTGNSLGFGNTQKAAIADAQARLDKMGVGTLKGYIKDYIQKYGGSPTYHASLPKTLTWTLKPKTKSVYTSDVGDFLIKKSGNTYIAYDKGKPIGGSLNLEEAQQWALDAAKKKGLIADVPLPTPKQEPLVGAGGLTWEQVASSKWQQPQTELSVSTKGSKFALWSKDKQELGLFNSLDEAQGAAHDYLKTQPDSPYSILPKQKDAPVGLTNAEYVQALKDADDLNAQARAFTPPPAWEPVPVKPIETLTPSQLTKTGGQLGSNAGGTYTDDLGAQWYVKSYDNPSQTWNELAANKIYEALGLKAAEATHISSPALASDSYASKLIPNVTQLKDVPLTPDLANQVLDGFVADVLTGNWDIVGTDMDNIVIGADGALYRIDNGGALLFRAQGTKKAAYGLENISEWNNFTNANVNPNYKKIFDAAGLKSADALQERALDQIDRVLKVRDQYGGWDNFLSQVVPGLPTEDKTAIAQMLEQRTDLLAQKKQTLFDNMLGKKSSRQFGEIDVASLSDDFIQAQKDVFTSKLAAGEIVHLQIKEWVDGSGTAKAWLAQHYNDPKHATAYKEIQDFSQALAFKLYGDAVKLYPLKLTRAFDEFDLNSIQLLGFDSFSEHAVNKPGWNFEFEIPTDHIFTFYQAHPKAFEKFYSEKEFILNERGVTGTRLLKVKPPGEEWQVPSEEVLNTLKQTNPHIFESPFETPKSVTPDTPAPDPAAQYNQAWLDEVKPSQQASPPRAASYDDSVSPMDMLSAQKKTEAETQMMQDLLDTLKPYVLQDLNDSASKVLPDTVQALAQQYIDSHVLPAMTESKLASNAMGRWMQAHTVLNYDNRFNVDQWNSFLAPFMFYPLHMGLNVAQDFIDRPALWTWYARMQDSLDAYTDDPEFPERLKGKVKIPLPFLPEEMNGGVFVDPTAPFNLKNLYRLDAMQRASYKSVPNTQETLRRMAEEGILSPEEAQNAIASQSGPAWDMAQAETANQQPEGNSVIEDMFSLHLPLQVLKNFLLDSPQDAENSIAQIPLFRMLRGVSAPFVQGGITPFKGKYDQYYVLRELGSLRAENKITDDEFKLAMLEQRGKAWNEAERRAALDNYTVPVLSGMTGFTGKVLPQGEAKYLDARLQRSQLTDAEITRLGGNPLMPQAEKYAFLKQRGAYDEGSLLQLFRGQHPELDMGQIYQEPEALFKQDLIDRIWQTYNTLPRLQKRLMSASLGEDFKTYFLNKDSRDYDQVSLADVTGWANALKIRIPKTAAFEQPLPTPSKITFADEKQTAAYDTFWNEIESQFATNKTGGHEYLDVIQSQYFKEDEVGRKALLQAHPELKQYWKLKDAFYADNPDILKLLERTGAVEMDTDKAQGFSSPLDSKKALLSQAVTMLFGDWSQVDQWKEEYYALPKGTGERTAYLKQNQGLLRYFELVKTIYGDEEKESTSTPTTTARKPANLPYYLRPSYQKTATYRNQRPGRGYGRPDMLLSDDVYALFAAARKARNARQKPQQPDDGNLPYLPFKPSPRIG